MYIFPGHLVFLTDQYGTDFADKNIMLNSRRVLEKVKKGHSNLVYTDIRSIYAELCCQLYFDDLQQTSSPPRMADQLMAARHQAEHQIVPDHQNLREDYKDER